MGFLPFFSLPKRNLVSPQDPDSAETTAPGSLVGSHPGDFQSEPAAFASKLAANQFGLGTNLVASQFESGVYFSRIEDGEI
jgi:hypothetical protein